MSNDVIEKLKNYCLNHPDLMEKGIIKGINSIDGKVVLEKDDISKNITIEDLENDKFDFDTFELKETKEVVQSSQLDSVSSIIEEPEEIESLEEQEIITNSNDKVPSTLADMKICAENKQEALIDSALEKFAIDERTGNVNINKAIKIITDNSVSNVVNSVRDNKVLSTDLFDYDIQGNPIKEFDISENKIDIETLIDDSFNNIMVYVEVAKLKNIIYNEAQIANAKNKYATSVKDRLNVLGLNQNDNNEISSQQVLTYKNSENVTSDIKPDNDIKKAGFADILILTVIILIYAAIIINLIMKLK